MCALLVSFKSYNMLCWILEAGGIDYFPPVSGFTFFLMLISIFECIGYSIHMQLTKGCKQDKCTNEYCASNPGKE